MHHIDKRIVTRLLDDAFASGYTVDVNDGGATVLRLSTNKRDIFAALESTDSDVLIFHDNGSRIGLASLVYGNEPGVIIADYSDNEKTNNLMIGADALACELGD